MILFFSETKFNIINKRPIKRWLDEISKCNGKHIGEVNIVFLNDEQLLKFNKNYLKHGTLTDIITFDYSEGACLNGDICISVERVADNAKKFDCLFEEELRRIMAHGILHLCGYKDKKKEEKIIMIQKEEEALLLFNRQYK